MIKNNTPKVLQNLHSTCSQTTQTQMVRQDIFLYPIVSNIQFFLKGVRFEFPEELIFKPYGQQ